MTLVLAIEDIASRQSLLDEMGMSSGEFVRYLHEKRVGGLIRVANINMYNRKTFSMPLSCTRFRIWLKLGGRDHPVDVLEELDRLKKLQPPKTDLIPPEDAKIA